MRMNDMWKIVSNNKLENNCEMLWACGEYYSWDGEVFAEFLKNLLFCSR